MPAALESNESTLSIRLKQLRLERHLTQTQLSKASGVAVSTLSKIEHNLMSPTYDVLLKLAQGLNVDIAELFTHTPAPMGSGRRVIHRAGQGTAHETPFYRHELLCSELSHKHMMPFRSRIKAHTPDTTEQWSRHEGEEFALVLAGSVVLHTECYAPETLHPGDCFYIDSRMGHRLTCATGAEAEVLWISTKPRAGTDT